MGNTAWTASKKTVRTRIRNDQSWGEKVFLCFMYVLIVLFSLVCVIPFWIVLVDSFASEASFLQYGYQLIPSAWSLDAYKYLLVGGQFLTSYKNSLVITIAGTVLAVTITSMFAYVLAHPKVKYRDVLSFLTYLAMVLGGGLVGFYMMVANWLHLKDSLWALILPYILNPFYAFILVAFYKSLPYEINEAATIDGAGDIRLFYKIILPISTPVIATVSLFYAIQYWNDWYLSLLFIDNYKLHPLQLMIRQLISNLNVSAYVGGGASYQVTAPTSAIQLATVCLTIGPIVLLYPFLQKYFVKGITIGAVKG
ncbi:carbohydrate ABC transporter permease [Paenibacillus alginolyticus]|uniref:Carbohydrate ABC transporter permease n=1 Tax=Paenibacillus alginolyticus TaxID=59839 RepID=A0ABT4GG20_9BACL|nr:carbohydrate ABC transporter permease [Paenibacillus alginolyticus]MCY9670725.1 carbohydrate ABC transporter permease [Paenibacillus alginolyticus]MCY9695123.1 carbohydrate ABC transporter permease [Paenibacillus alginolyticus]MEC0147944.1 carbohydrate ABC transporter permease [Paenibacillus alginolyticus]